MSRKLKKPTVAQRIAQGMAELEAAMRDGRPPGEQFNVRTVIVDEPSVHDADSVRRMRAKLGVSQGVFARLLAVSPELVENWEQGISAPRGVARRLLDEIGHDPGSFLSRHLARTKKVAQRVR